MNETSPKRTEDSADFFKRAYESICKMQIAKNKAYGESALKPLDIFARHHPYGARLDEKLARIKNAPELYKNDLADIIGGCMLICKDRGWDNFEDLVDNTPSDVREEVGERKGFYKAAQFPAFPGKDEKDIMDHLVIVSLEKFQDDWKSLLVPSLDTLGERQYICVGAFYWASNTGKVYAIMTNVSGIFIEGALGDPVEDPHTVVLLCELSERLVTWFRLGNLTEDQQYWVKHVMGQLPAVQKLRPVIYHNDDPAPSPLAYITDNIPKFTDTPEELVVVWVPENFPNDFDKILHSLNVPMDFVYGAFYFPQDPDEVFLISESENYLGGNAPLNIVSVNTDKHKIHIHTILSPSKDICDWANYASRCIHQYRRTNPPRKAKKSNQANLSQ